MSATRISLLAGTLALAASAVQGAPNLNINGLTIETGTGKTLGTLSSQGGMDEFTKLQKELVLTVIKQLGIDLETLPPAVRGQIEKPQTSNPQALQAFAKGLDLADKGQFKDAAAAFKEAARHDPGFGLAAGMARLMPNVNVGAGGGGNELRAMRRTAREEGQRHADRQLQRMNQGGGRMKDLGLSDGRGGKDKEARMDPVELVVDETDSGRSDLLESARENTGVGDSKKSIEDVQRDIIDEIAGHDIVASLSGFAAGYVDRCDYYQDSCIQQVIASDSPTSAQLGFRVMEDEGLTKVYIDASIFIDGDMFAGGAGPIVDMVNISTCDAFTESCYGSDYSVSYYDGTEYFYTHQSTTSDGIDDYHGVGYSLEGYYDSVNQFSYSTWGSWVSYGYQSVGESTDMEYDDEGFWVAGELTSPAQMPLSGVVSYTGGMIGYTQDKSLLLGEMNWNVNFGSRTVTGSFDNIMKNGLTWLSSVTVNGGWSAGHNLVSADLGNGSSVTGVAKGVFFGPSAQELGGSWRINHGEDTGAGIFLGKHGGVPFDQYVGGDLSSSRTVKSK